MHAYCWQADPRGGIMWPVLKEGTNNHGNVNKRKSDPPCLPNQDGKREERYRKCSCIIFLPSSFKEK